MSAAVSLVERHPADLGLCNSGYCDRGAVVYVARYRGRLVVISGSQAAKLGSTGPLELRCGECAHHELDEALERA